MMSRRSLLNLALLVVALGLAVLVVWDEPNGPEQEAIETLTPLSAADVRSIRISDSGGRDIQLEWQNGQWRMLHPYRLEANQGRIAQLLRITGAPVRADYPLARERRAEFGLAPPRARLQLDQLVLDFGINDPIYFRRYVATADRLKLINEGFQHHVIAAAEAYVSPNLLPEQAEILSIQTPAYRIERQPGQYWNLVPPQPGLSADAIQARVDAWQQAQAVEITRLDAEADGDPVEIRLLDRPAPVSFLVSADQPGTLIDPERGLVYRLARGSELLRPPGGLPATDDAGTP